MSDLDARLIIPQRPLPSPQEMADERQKRQIQQQEVDLRAQEIAMRGEALRQAAMQRGQKAAVPAVDPKKQLDYQLKLGTAIADKFRQAIAQPETWPAQRMAIAQIAGPDAIADLPEDWASAAPIVQQHAAAWPAHEAAVKSNLQRIETTDEQGNPVQKFITPTEGASYPIVQKPATTTPSRPVQVETVDEKGRRITKFVVPEEGASYPKPAPAASGGGSGVVQGGLDEGGLELAATRFRVTGTLPARDSKQNAAIMNAAAKQAKEIGQSPAATIQKQAAYKGDAAALQDIAKRAASAEAFENKALGQIPIIQELSAKVPRTSMPIINAALQSGRTAITGDSNATQLANAIETFTEEYAKIMGGSTGSAAGATDSSRAAAKRLLNTAMSKGTMNDVLALMQREMALTMAGYDATKQHISERMVGTGSTTTTSTTTANPASTQSAPGVPSYQDYLNRKKAK